jgi:hypothetical protein
MKYHPSKTALSNKTTAKNIHFTVAGFIDKRKISDALVIGKVIKIDGSSVNVFPRHQKAVDAVTLGFKDYLKRAGYPVRQESPEWDLQVNTIRQEWGGILVGGSIEYLDLTCNLSIPMKYDAKVQLTVLFADSQSGQIFYKTVVESSFSREDIAFSEEEMGRQISGALSDAIEKVFEKKALIQKIEETAGGLP